jgi:serine/threonine-protein kinase
MKVPSTQPGDGSALSTCPTLPALDGSEAEPPEWARGSERAIGVGDYELGEILGRGGMGEVVVARDRRIGRDVAVKRMRNRRPSENEIGRFMREAQIQACLDHPAIVPVHELGSDAEGRPYFTMRRLSGTTLAALLESPSARPRLLRAFVDVCLALDFAHAHGVVHRDVKPSNIMLGDFGEVYVLDWGVARIVGEHEIVEPRPPTDPGDTEVGAILGTPGYAAPEQLRGQQVTGAADVYALGSILFEILTGEPLHSRTNAFADTLDRPVDSPVARAPDRGIAPELDAACVAALAESPHRRLTARQLADRVQGYLDGDRDLARRQALAADQLDVARAALLADPIRGRAAAMRAAGRALALDQDSSAAADLVSTLMLEPPRELPADLGKRIEHADASITRGQATRAMLALLAFFPFLPIVLWMGVEDAVLVAAVFVMVGVVSGGLWWLSRRARPNLFVLAPLLGALLVVVCARAMSPYFIVPGLLTTVTLALISFPPLIDRPVIVIGTMMASFAVPLVLELAGVIAPTWELVDGGLLMRTPSFTFAGFPATAFLIVAHLTMVLVIGLYARSLAVARRDYHRRLENQAWHLAQMLPEQPPARSARA